MHSTDGTKCETCSWVKDKPGQLTERWNTPLTPAYKYINKTVCDPDRHTVGQWCGLEGLIDDMLEAGADAASGQLSPGVWMNECHITDEFPEGITDQVRIVTHIEPNCGELSRIPGGFWPVFD